MQVINFLVKIGEYHKKFKDIIYSEHFEMQKRGKRWQVGERESLILQKN